GQTDQPQWTRWTPRKPIALLFSFPQCPLCSFVVKGSALSRLRLDANLLQSLIVGVFAVVFADILEQRVIRHPSIGVRDGPRLLERDRILHRNLVPEDVW